MKINGKALGITLGLMWGGTIFIATIVLIVKAQMGLHHAAGAPVGPTLLKLGQFYMGYSMSFFGAILGGIYGFLNGYVGGWLLAKIYNFLAVD